MTSAPSGHDSFRFWPLDSLYQTEAAGGHSVLAGPDHTVVQTLTFDGPRMRDLVSRMLMTAALAATVSLVAAAPLAVAQPAAPGAPALGIYPQNATRVTAHVLRQHTYATEPRYAVTLEIESARQARADLPMGPAAGTIEAFSREPLAAALAGRRIEAVVTITGDTLASRWLISDVRVLGD